MASGADITLLPRLAVAIEARTPDLVCAPIGPSAPARPIRLAWRPTSTRAAEYRSLGALRVPRERAWRGRAAAAVL